MKKTTGRTRYPKCFTLPGIQSEEYEFNDCNVPDPEKWAKETLNKFNATLHAGELARIFVGIQILERNTRPDHNWEKTNLVTIISKGKSYDAAKCKVCGITSKRFGIGGGYVRDPKFADSLYSRCDAALQKLFPKRHK